MEQRAHNLSSSDLARVDDRSRRDPVAADADVVGYEPVWLDGAVAGFCTSGGYSHFADKSVAIGFLPAERVTDGLRVEIEILGERRPAVLRARPLFDPDGARMRG